MKNVAIVLAAGQGSRMQSDVAKQYIMLKGKPVLYYSLRAFSLNDKIDEIVLVTGNDDIEYCKKNIIDFYGLKKVSKIVAGGKERYNSVYNGLEKIKTGDYVFIHDGARPFIDNELIYRLFEGVVKYGACVAGVQVKDTIKISDEEGIIKGTPKRDGLWAIQTPQVFLRNLINEAYSLYIESGDTQATDDAMILEKMLNHNIKIIEGSYKNIKITTPEDMLIAEAFMR